MSVCANLEPKKVFEIFENICSIPHGSGNMKGIADFCVEFAKKHSLEFHRDQNDNVVIFKNATAGYENAEPIILQGHLDMVCQKTADCTIDFEKDGLSLFLDGDFLKAKNTTLGADNGIAVAFILSILASNTLKHPKIEAVFTTDEEVGLIGAIALDMNILSAKRMINIDSEESDAVTISCAGGSDFAATLALESELFSGTEVSVTLKGLKGGHSGICINEGRSNANLLAAKYLNALNVPFKLISIAGGDKGNAIPNVCEIRVLAEDFTEFKTESQTVLKDFQGKLQKTEPDFDFEILNLNQKTLSVLTDDWTKKLINIILNMPNGVIKMSEEIDGLVETSLNLGVLKADTCSAYFYFALRSNKRKSLSNLENTLKDYFGENAVIKTAGHYPPWEFNSLSKMRDIYLDTYKTLFGETPKVEAIHAGLECGVFADAIRKFDCIAIGPDIFDAHTVNERLSVSSAAKIYKLLTEILEKCQ
jgi:dipeptidase D